MSPITPMPVQAEALIIRGVARAAAGDVAAGREDVARGRAIRADLGQLVGWAVTAQIAARVEMLAGDPTQAEALLREDRTNWHGSGRRPTCRPMRVSEH